MKTFHIQTLGCKVNHYESEQIATLLRSRGLVWADAGSADLRIVHSCSVTTQAASQSRQSVRRLIRLPLCNDRQDSTVVGPQTASTPRPKTIVTGCWATSNRAEATDMPGVDAVLGHDRDVAGELDRLLTLWKAEGSSVEGLRSATHEAPAEAPKQSCGNSMGWNVAESRAGQITDNIKPKSEVDVNRNLGNRWGAGEQPNAPEFLSSPFSPGAYAGFSVSRNPAWAPGLIGDHPKRVTGATSLPQLGARQVGRQRAVLKIQDGCDAHCTYCIIPKLRPALWSKPIESAVAEAAALIAAGHVEIVLTGIFLGAYGQSTALRRRQDRPTAEALGELVHALCVGVPGLRRLRLSSLEPGDLTPSLIEMLRRHRQVVPHFHLPLQSGSDALLRRMNRQYTRGEFLEMVNQATAAFDRPALTTDIVVGFPGEGDGEFEETISAVRAAGFIHVHAFPYSARPGTAAARWTKQMVRGPVVNERIQRLREIAEEQSLAFRRSFIGQSVEVIVERDSEKVARTTDPAMRHGRCERYFPVTFHAPIAQPGETIRVKIVDATKEGTSGERE